MKDGSNVCPPRQSPQIDTHILMSITASLFLEPSRASQVTLTWEFIRFVGIEVSEGSASEMGTSIEVPMRVDCAEEEQSPNARYGERRRVRGERPVAQLCACTASE